MTEQDSELLQRLVVGSKRDGRRRYDKQAKAELAQVCLKPGASVVRVALTISEKIMTFSFGLMSYRRVAKVQ